MILMRDNHGQVGDYMTNNFNRRYEPPHPGNPNARTCPQCGELTWRYTQNCICCGTDISLRDQEIAAWQTHRLDKRFGMTAIVIGALWTGMEWLEFLPQAVPHQSLFGLTVLLCGAFVIFGGIK